MFILFSLILFFLNILSVNKIREIKFYKNQAHNLTKYLMNALNFLIIIFI